MYLTRFSKQFHELHMNDTITERGMHRDMAMKWYYDANAWCDTAGYVKYVGLDKTVSNGNDTYYHLCVIMAEFRITNNEIELVRYWCKDGVEITRSITKNVKHMLERANITDVVAKGINAANTIPVSDRVEMFYQMHNGYVPDSTELSFVKYEW